jgi:hypothetical protein
MSLLARCVLGAALLLGLGAAAPPDDPIVGSHWPATAVFDTPPPRAQPAPGSACEAANRYVSLVGADRASEVPGLFAPDGQVMGVDDKMLRGPAEIATFYNRVHLHGVIPISFIDRGRECIMEIAGGRPGRGDPPGHNYLLAIDHFTVGTDGKIERLIIFFRPGMIPPSM